MPICQIRPGQARPAEIAGLLHISEATVKTHVGHIMAKLGLRDRIQVVVYAYDTGLIAPRGRRSGESAKDLSW